MKQIRGQRFLIKRQDIPSPTGARTVSDSRRQRSTSATSQSIGAAGFAHRAQKA
jgi:hypothetical protein